MLALTFRASALSRNGSTSVPTTKEENPLVSRFVVPAESGGPEAVESLLCFLSLTADGQNTDVVWKVLPEASVEVLHASQPITLMLLRRTAPPRRLRGQAGMAPPLVDRASMQSSADRV